MRCECCQQQLTLTHEQVPVGVIQSALSRPGVEFGTQSECGLRVVVHADLAPSASAQHHAGA